MPEDRARPGPWDLDVAAGVDSDGDGRADTVVTDDGVDLILLTDLDGDGLADQILRIGPDAVVRLVGPEPATGEGLLDAIWPGLDG